MTRIHPYLYLILLLTIGTRVSAQTESAQLLSSAGTVSNNGNIVVNWSVGELVTGEIQLNNSTTVVQGLYQANIIVTSISPAPQDIQVEVFPNPTSDYLTIQTKVTDRTTIRLHDLKGNLIFTEETNSNNPSLKLNLTPYNDGTYILTIDSDYHTHQGKFKIIKTSGN